MYGHLGEHLTVEGDPCLLQAVHEHAVAHALCPDCCADAGDPQSAEIPFLSLPVVLRPRQRGQVRFSCSAVNVLALTPIAFGDAEQLFTLLVALRRAFYSHCSSSPFLVIGQKVLHLSGHSLINVSCFLEPAQT